MRTATTAAERAGLPEGYAAVPIDPAGVGLAGLPVRVCAVVRREADPVAGRFVVVREAAVGRAYLGCLTDAAGHVLDWLEVWVQALPATGGGPPAGGPLTNAAADARWDRTAAAFARLGSVVGFLATGWDRGPARPLVVTDDDSRIAAWGEAAVCTDDAALAAAGLPGYATSAHRYAGGPGFAALTAGSAAAAGPAAGAGPPADGFNPAGGRMLVRRHGPVPVRAMLDVLAGRGWRGVGHGAGTVAIPGGVARLREASATEGEAAGDEGRLFLGRHGRRGRVVESYHLRVRLLSDMVEAVRRAVAATGLPMLSLAPESFQLRLPDPAGGLPFLWGAEVLLADVGEAERVAVPGSSLTYVAAPAGRPGSVYRPAAAGRTVGGVGTVRIRGVVPDAAQGLIVEGTLSTAERLDRRPGQLLWFGPATASGPVDLYARMDGAEPGAAGELRFRTVGQRMPAGTAAALTAAAGVPLDRVPFATVAAAGVGEDLYALGVMAVEAMLVDPQASPLPVALDELMTTGRWVADHADAGATPGERVRAAFDADPRRLAALGPHRLTSDPIDPRAALDLIPGDLWFDTLATVLRLFDAARPEANAGYEAAPQRAFDAALADLDGLIRRSRSLVVIDWQYNREVRAAIRMRLAGM